MKVKLKLLNQGCKNHPYWYSRIEIIRLRESNSISIVLGGLLQHLLEEM